MCPLAVTAAPGGSAQVEVLSGGHELLDRLRTDARYAFDVSGGAVVTVVAVELGHGGEMLLGVRRYPELGELGGPRLPRQVHVGHRTPQSARELVGQFRHVDR